MPNLTNPPLAATCASSNARLVETHDVEHALRAYSRTWRGLRSATFWILFGVFNFVGTIGSGWLSGRFDNRCLIAVIAVFAIQEPRATPQPQIA